MRNFSAYAAVLAATLTAAPALAETYRDAAPELGQVTAPSTAASTNYGFGATGLGVSPRNDRDGDAAPESRVVNPSSVARAASFGITSPEAGERGRNFPFNSPRFD